MLALKITTDCEVKKIDVNEPLHVSIRDELGGYLEIVRPRRLKQPLCMIVDEEGLLKELPESLMGSYLYETDKHGQPIVGDIIIMKEQMTNDGIVLTGLSAQDIHDFMQEHRNALYHFERYVKDRGGSKYDRCRQGIPRGADGYVGADRLQVHKQL